MQTKDIELLLGLTEIIENHKYFTGEDFKVYNALDQVLNNEEFERLHPRDEDGKFAKSNSSKSTESNVQKLHIPSPEYKAIMEKVKEDSNKTINPNTIIDSYVKSIGFNGDRLRNRIKEIDAEMNDIRNNKKDTQHKYKIDGEYIEERKLKHENILKEIFANKENARPKNGERPKVIFLGGRGGSGKSKFDLPGEENKGGVGVYDRSKYIVLDADDIKERMKPDYKGYNAAEVHEESSDILNMALEKALNEGLNVVLDATMKTKKSTLNKVNRFKESKHNYDIEMYYMHLPLEKAAERAIGRFVGKHGKMDGRYVPLHVILNDMKHNEEVFDELKHLASKWAFYNNDVPKQEDKPILIDKNY